jgi:hypothetical protein
MAFAVNRKPYSFFITLTLKRKQSLWQFYKHTTFLLHLINSKIFSREYKDKSKYISGFAFVEDHKNGSSNNDIHIHLLIEHNARLDDFSFKEHKAIFHEAAGKVCDVKNRRVFSDKCINIQKAGDDGRISYCFKQLWDGNLDRLKTIGKDGLSDMLTDI